VLHMYIYIYKLLRCQSVTYIVLHTYVTLSLLRSKGAAWLGSDAKISCGDQSHVISKHDLDFA